MIALWIIVPEENPPPDNCHPGKLPQENYDVEIVCLTMEIQVCLLEPKYEQQVSRP